MPSARIHDGARAVRLVLFLLLTALSGVAGGETTEPTRFFEVKRLNAGIPQDGDLPDHSSPQAMLEALMSACAEGDMKTSAAMVDWSFVDVTDRQPTSQKLTPKLCYILRRNVTVDWETISDRPDGQYDRPRFPEDPLAGQPRRSLIVDRLEAADHSTSLRLRRVKEKNGEPVWLVAPQFVDDIEPLYEHYGPNDYVSLIPESLKRNAIGAIRWWEIAALPLCLLIAAGLGWALGRALTSAFDHFEKMWIRILGPALQRPLEILIGVISFNVLTLLVLRLDGDIGRMIRPISKFAMVAAIAWTAIRAVSAVATFIRQRYAEADLSDEEEAEARKKITHVSVVRRVVAFGMFVAAIGATLSELDMLQSLGIALLSSAGAMGVLLGVAGHRVLGNILAGLQIAVTKPVRIGDCVLFEGHYGWVEDITYTYLTIRTFSHQRLVVPFTHFLSKPVINKSHTDPQLNEPVFLTVDAQTSVDEIRAYYLEVVENHPDWCPDEEPKLEVVDLDGDDVKLRLRATSTDPGRAWDLHCHVREKMIAFLGAARNGRYLPRSRLELATKATDEVEQRRAS